MKLVLKLRYLKKSLTLLLLLQLGDYYQGHLNAGARLFRIYFRYRLFFYITVFYIITIMAGNNLK